MNKDTESKYWLITFSHNVCCKWQLEKGEDVVRLIQIFLKDQNCGEAKSDRLILQSKKQVTKEQFEQSGFWEQFKPYVKPPTPLAPNL